MTPAPTTATPAGFDVLAAGAVLWRPAADGPEVALVHRPRYGDWSFPKGKLEPGEAMPFAAVREVCEETGFGCRLGPGLGDVRYPVTEGRKLVRYWAARAGQGAFATNAETDRLRWLDPTTAHGLLSYDHDRQVLARFLETGRPRALVLLVRHAKAGSRQQWHGPDAQRPLTDAGQEQARRLSGLLELFGPQRVHSAPLRRCQQTVAPLAERLGLEVHPEPLLSEAAYDADPTAALARFRELAEWEGVTVVSSQGGVNPGLVAALATATPVPGVDPSAVPARKGSTWVLGVDRHRLGSADYFPEPSGA